MARSAKFNVWESKTRRGRFYRATILGKRAGTKPPDQSFASPKAAFDAVAEEWVAYAKALGVYGKHSKVTFLATHPIPWASGSLKPAIRLTPKARKAIKRHTAIDKIVEGAKIGTFKKKPVFARRASDKEITAAA